MKRWMPYAVLATVIVAVAAPVEARRVVVHKGPHRTKVVVHRAFPIHRAFPTVIVRPARVAVVSAPILYVSPVVWVAAPVAAPPRDIVVWQDGEALSKRDGWTEFTLTVNGAGRKLYMQIDGKVRLNFAEVVFANGDALVVDFKEATKGDGVYPLLDFADGRRVSHVRMVAMAKSGSARVDAYMVK